MFQSGILIIYNCAYDAFWKSGTFCAQSIHALFSLAIHGKEHAGTKKQASNGLSLQLVSQLYQMGVIEAHRAPGEKKKVNQVAMIETIVITLLCTETL